MIRIKTSLWIGALVAGAAAVGVQAEDASFRGGTSFSCRRAAEELRLDLAAAYAYVAPGPGSWRVLNCFSKSGWPEADFECERVGFVGVSASTERHPAGGEVDLASLDGLDVIGHE